jgi:hypothetical protein
MENHNKVRNINNKVIKPAGLNIPWNAVGRFFALKTSKAGRNTKSNTTANCGLYKKVPRKNIAKNPKIQIK